LQTFFIHPKSVLSRLHPSWYEDVVASCPKVLSALALQAIQEEMGITKKTFSDEVRGFLLQEVLCSWSDRGVAPDSSPELPFLNACTEKHLNMLADLISVNDLVSEVRKIVEKKKLQVVFERLSEIQQKYLKELLQGKKFHACFSFDFKTFIKLSPKQAKELLHTEGLKKVGIVLKSEAAATNWLVLHRMDKKEAFLIQEGKEQKEPCDLKQLQKKFVHAFQFVQRYEK